MTIDLPGPVAAPISLEGKGVRNHLPERPSGCFAQKVPDTFSAAAPGSTPDDAEVREQFQNILGELLFGQMLKSMRKTVGEAAYFNGGRAEEIFTEQLDQHIARNMSKTSADQFVGPMYDLAMTGRR